MDCVFCKIMNKEIPSYTLYEDDIVKVILDINPSTNGDCMIIPKKHIENINDIDEDTYMHIFHTAKKMYPLLTEKLNCKGLTLVQNNGLGQDIKHYHLHLTPRYENDHVMHSFNKEILVDLEKVYEQITK